MPRLDIDRYLDESSYRVEIQHQVVQLGILGYCVFGGTPRSLACVLEELQQLRSAEDGQPLVFSADCEFGLPMRLREGGTEFPDAMAIARADKSGDARPAYEAAESIAKEMRLLGLHWNFAPVADINSNPRNPIISTRSFGETAELVSKQTRAFNRGLLEHGIVSTAKHFPGHGDTSQDSHRELPYLEYTLADFQKRELAPFAALIDAGVPSVMTAHIATPKLAAELGAAFSDETRLPASLSPFITRGLLRDSLRFDGVIVTDALEMKAITDSYGARDAARRAFQAGADVILMPSDVSEAILGVEQALLDSPKRGNESSQRILKIAPAVRSAEDSIDERLSAFERQLPISQRVSDRIAESAIEITGELPGDVGMKLLILVDDREQACRKAEQFRDEISSRFASAQIVNFGEAGDIVIDKPSVICTVHRARGYIGGDDRTAVANRVLERIAARNSEHLKGLIMIGSPYVERYFDPMPAYHLKTYGEAYSSIHAAAKKILETR